MLNSYKSNPMLGLGAFSRKHNIIEAMKEGEPKSQAQESAILKMNKSKSEHKMRSELGITPEKRVRLRDYLFIASTSSTRNHEKKHKLKVNQNEKEKESVSSSISALRRQKYQIPNSEMHEIVKNEIYRQLQSIIKQIQVFSQTIINRSDQNLTNDDLVYLYNVRRLVGDKMKASLKEINDLEFKYGKSGKIISEMISIGLHPDPTPIPEEDEDRSKIERSTNPNSFFQSLIMGSMS